MSGLDDADKARPGEPAPRMHTPQGLSKADVFRRWPPERRENWLASLTAEEAIALEYDWSFWARAKQLPPKERYLIWLVLAGRGFGKALELSTPLPTPTGWTTIGEVCPGDELFDEQGNPCRVTRVHDVLLGEPCSRVTFADGTPVIVDDGHLWLTWDRAARKPGGVPEVRATAAIAQTLRSEGELNHSVQNCQPLQLRELLLPMAPYQLGLWLGGRGSRNKLMPPLYLRASVAQRTALLAGLGGATELGGSKVFSALKLAESVRELACSLGYDAVICSAHRSYRVVWSATCAYRMIHSVEPVESVPVRCIEVDSPSRLFLCTRSFIPTHNTRTGAEWVIDKAMNSRAGTRITLAGRTEADAVGIMVHGQSGILAHSPPWFLPRFIEKDHELRWPNGVIGMVFGATRPDAFRGWQHNYVWCLVGSTPVAMADGTQRPLSTVRPGDRVLTRRGPRTVKASALTRKQAAVFRLSIMGGQDIVGTAEHPVWVEGRGFVPLCSLRQGMRVCVIDASNGAESCGITTVSPATTNATSKRRGTSSESSIFTAGYGKTTTAHSPRDGWFTTLTTTSATIALRIYKLLRLPSMLVAITRESGYGFTLKRPYGWRLPQRVRSAKNGGQSSAHAPFAVAAITAAQKTRFGIAQWFASTRRVLDVLFPRAVLANAAAPSTWRHAGCSCTAQSNATPPQIKPGLDKTLSRSLAPNALSFLQAPGLTLDSVAAHAPLCSTQEIASVVKLAAKKDVYDIAVEGEREFFANGILVHNCDEVASWSHWQCLDQLKLGLRLGSSPCGIITTTPRPIPQLRELIKQRTTITTSGTTYENLQNVAPTFASEILAQYEGTRLGLQELEARILDDSPTALWKRSQLDQNRVTTHPRLARIVVGVDPAGSNSVKSNNTGIVVAGIGVDGEYYVLEDGTMNAQPTEWATQVAALYHRFKADRVIGEVNMGGDMVAAVVKAVDPSVAFKGVHASRGKATRAEPISALYEQNKVHHVGFFPKLEDEMCSFDPLSLENLRSDSSSPDRVDALCWSLTELTDGRKPVPKMDFNKSPARVNPYQGF